jgi:hypothetical protein
LQFFLALEIYTFYAVAHAFTCQLS